MNTSVLFLAIALPACLITGCAGQAVQQGQRSAATLPSEGVERKQHNESGRSPRQDLAAAVERFLSLRAAGKRHEAFVELRKGFEPVSEAGYCHMIVLPALPPRETPSLAYERATEQFRVHHSEADKLSAEGDDEGSLSEFWLAVESCPIHVWIVIHEGPGAYFSPSCRYDPEDLRSPMGMEELLTFLRNGESGAAASGRVSASVNQAVFPAEGGVVRIMARVQGEDAEIVRVWAELSAEAASLERTLELRKETGYYYVECALPPNTRPDGHNVVYKAKVQAQDSTGHVLPGVWVTFVVAARGDVR